VAGRLLVVLLAAAAPGCDLFSTRSPEAPVVESGTYLQPDTPDQVVANLQAAIAELNPQNYRRVFDDAFTFEPTATATAQNQALWTGWGRAEEERYFNSLAAAAQFTAGNELRLNDETSSFVDEGRFDLHATYVLTVNHRNAELPVTVQGRLVWTIRQGPDGLWRLVEWTDEEIEGRHSWSDLKAEFVK
jgi:hypothetical protein